MKMSGSFVFFVKTKRSFWKKRNKKRSFFKTINNSTCNMQWRIIWALWFLIWGWVASVWHQITEVKHTCPQPLTGLVSRRVWFPHSSQTCGYDHLKDVEGQRGVCQQLSMRTTRKKIELDWSKWMMMKRGKIDKHGESVVASL